MSYYLMLDVGGTSVKAGVLTAEGSLYRDILQTYPACARGSKADIFANFAQILVEAASLIDEKTPDIGGIGMAFPGPFDYDNGISLMKGLHKYEDIYGESIADNLSTLLPPHLAKLHTTFLHDVEAFALGVCHFDVACEGEKRLLHICIGTGAGSAFTQGGVISRAAEDGVLCGGWIYNYPFKESIIDDYISARGLERLAKKQLGQESDGRKLYELAQRGDLAAIAVFAQFGQDLNDALSPFIESFKPQAIVLGGQISQSFCHFGTALMARLERENIRIYLQENTSVRILQGLLIAQKAQEN